MDQRALINSLLSRTLQHNAVRALRQAWTPARARHTLTDANSTASTENTTVDNRYVLIYIFFFKKTVL